MENVICVIYCYMPKLVAGIYCRYYIVNVCDISIHPLLMLQRLLISSWYEHLYV